MVLKKTGAMILLGIGALGLLIAALALPAIFKADPVLGLIRIFALYGYLFVSVAVFTTPFLKEITLSFGKSFLKVHHAFAIMGVVLITLHPIFDAVLVLSPLVFVPKTSSWIAFWAFAGSPAFALFYIAVLASVLRAKALKYWRTFHALMYVVLFFGVVHANLLGEDFQNLGITILFDSLFVTAILSFALKRYRNHKLRTRNTKKVNSLQNMQVGS
jgi:predicted ferric reductase